MRWIMQRDQQQLRCEIQTGAGATPYALMVTAPDGRNVIAEQSSEPYALHERVSQVERLLTRFGWRCPHLTTRR